jgi:hypothetical protein
MGKRRLRSEERLMRQWRACGLLSFAVVIGFAVLYLAVKFIRRNADEHHAHRPAPHGGVIASAGNEDAHYHVEALLDRGHTLKLYTYGEDVDEVLRVEHQILTVQAKAEAGAESTPLVLMPMPQSGDPEGKTSRFFGKLPQELWGKPLTVHVPGIDLAGRQLPLDFTITHPERQGDGFPGKGDEEGKLLLSPGGKYTEADVQANGGMPASRKYKGLRASHDVRPRPGERLCPVSLTKANREFIWVVGGNSYAFCCPPCIEEFVWQAKEQPREIREPPGLCEKVISLSRPRERSRPKERNTHEDVFCRSHLVRRTT